MRRRPAGDQGDGRRRLREGRPGSPGGRDHRPADRPPGRARTPADRLPGLPHRGHRPVRGRQPRAAGGGGRRHRAGPPMAGTARGGDPAADQRLAASLLASSTYRHEHQVTIDVVHDTLLNWCSYVDYEAEPSVVAVANLQHLATLVEGRLSQPTPSVLDLVAALHPTPAVAGRPRGSRSTGSPGTRASTAGGTPARRDGSTPPATAPGRSRSGAPRSRARPHSCGRATASWPTATR